MAQEAYFFANTRSYPRVSGIQIVPKFRGFMFMFGTSYVALINNLIFFMFIRFPAILLVKAIDSYLQELCTGYFNSDFQ